MVARAYNPERGDIIVLNFSPQSGREMAGEHRAIVLSERAFNVATGLLVACPITTKIKGSPFEVPIPPGLKAKGCVLASEIRALDYLARTARFTERAPVQLVQNVQAIACAVLGCT